MQDAHRREDDGNLITAQIAQTLKSAGLEVDAKYITERTGIPVEKMEQTLRTGLRKFIDKNEAGTVTLN